MQFLLVNILQLTNTNDICEQKNSNYKKGNK